ncbi:Lsr2 family protein [Dactylosporangium sucinum]|uniref:histone-like nucleoid-structuring protein Lsr2 n=1 Tax=Dactylosporangium sucinum TaxID=1424081 RepID=UPI0027E561F7|nr:Lsr2 family protein [Dactylosporangium sucinum]
MIQQVIDDIDGGPADESLAFGVDGVLYTIDLSAGNAGRLRDALAPFVAAATKVGRAAPVAAGRGRRSGPGMVAAGPVGRDRERSQAVREWAQRQGIEVSDRGRLARDVIDRYRDAHRD